MLSDAIIIATNAHKGQKDKAGKEYILHPLRVMLSLETQDEMICGVLHDVIEDSDVSIRELQEFGFSNDVVAAIECLTKKENEEYDNFILRVSKNKLAIKVKIADLKDNMDLSRLKNYTEKDILRKEKYERAITYLTNLV